MKLVRIDFLGLVKLIKFKAESKLKCEGCLSIFKQSILNNLNF